MQKSGTNQEASSSPALPEHRLLTSADMKGPIDGEPLPGKELDHRRRSSPSGRCSTLPPVSVTEYIAKRWDCDRKQFRSTLAQGSILFQTPIEQIEVQRIQKKVVVARCRHKTVLSNTWERLGPEPRAMRGVNRSHPPAVARVRRPRALDGYPNEQKAGRD